MQHTIKITDYSSFQDNKEHLIRPRLNILLAQAIRKPITIVCAGMGCGKTQAVYDFTRQCEIPSVWRHLSKSDNIAQHFWENFVHELVQFNKSLLDEYKKIGFPDSNDKMNMYFNARDRGLGATRRIFVFDDVHLITNTVILNFLEQALNRLSEMSSIILITRELPQINLSALILRNKIHIINESELNFTENELNQFLLSQGLDEDITNLSKIYQDTKGWVFLVNFVVRMLKKSPGYSGYIQSVIKQDISQLLETEVWNVISVRLKNLLLRLSLSDHRSTELAGILAGGDECLVSELKRQNAFIRFDRYTDSYQIHHFLLDFLHARQDLLSADEKQKTWKTVADWCVKNDYMIDALRYYEKVSDYNSIVSILLESIPRFFIQNVQQLAGIFDRAPQEIFDTVEFSAVIHIQVVMNLFKPRETLDLIRRYEAKYLALPEDSPFRNRMLGGIYYNWAVLRLILCTMDDRYDFDAYFSKMYEYLKNYPMRPACWLQHTPGMWTNLTGTERAGAPREFLNAVISSLKYVQKCLNGLAAGADELCQGELLFYQGDVAEAEAYITAALERGQEYQQYEIVCRALFYRMRIAVVQGDAEKITQALKGIESQIAHNEYSFRFLIYDIVSAWYYYILGQSEKFPDWLKEKFTYRYDYPNSFESFGNTMKAKYFCLKRNYAEVLEYIGEKKQRPTLLFERIELLVLEACVRLKTKDKREAVRVLHKAYKTAQPNGIVMPFIERGTVMRKLIKAAENDPGCAIPQLWLKGIKQGAAMYSRNQAVIVSEYEKTTDTKKEIALSPREKEILHDLYEGLSRTEIAAKYGSSINTIKLHINSIYNKTGARNRADIFRIAEEYDLL